MVYLPVDNDYKDTFFITFLRSVQPERTKFFITIGIEKLPVEGIVAFFELALRRARIAWGGTGSI